METTTIKEVTSGMAIRRFASDAFRTVESVEFYDMNKAGHLFYWVRFVGGGAEMFSTFDTIELEGEA